MSNRSFTYSAEAAFRAVADPTRRAVLDLLRQGRLPAGEIARAFPVSRPAISKHLRVLRHARLVRMQRAGRQRFFELDPEPLRSLDEWLGRYRSFWKNQLSNLKRFVEAAEEQKAPGQRRQSAKDNHEGDKHGSTAKNSKNRRNRQ